MFRIENDTLVCDIASQIDSQNVQIMQNDINSWINSDKTFKNIKINMTSLGGSPNYAISLYHYLINLPYKIITVNTGFVESSAVIVFLAGEERFAHKNSTFLIHEVTKNYNENTKINFIQMNTELKTLAEIIKMYNSIFNERTQFAESPLQILDFLVGCSQLIVSDELAVKHGFIQRII